MQTDLGFGFRKLGRGLKRIGKVAYKYSGTGLVVKSNIALAKLSAKLALLPLILLRRAVRALGRVLCKAPPELLKLAAAQANVDPDFIPPFCAAVQVDKWNLSAVRKMLPPALKIALKLGASGAFPPIVPALAIIKHIPGVGKFAGVDDLGYYQNHGRWINTDGIGSYHSSFRSPLLRQSVDTMHAVALADHLGLMEESEAAAMGLSGADREAMQGYLQGATLEAASTETKQRVLMGLLAGASVLGIALTARKTP